MYEHLSDPARPEAWGDVVMPTEAEQRAAQLSGAPANRAPGDDPPTRGVAGEGVEPSSSVRQGTQGYGSRATTSQPSTDIHYDTLPLGPGNEAMEGGISPAPRGYTGGAMGKFVAGLSPSFTDAAMGIPAPAGSKLYTPAEAVTTFSATSDTGAPIATHPPEQTPEERSGAREHPEGPRTADAAQG